MGTSPDLMRPLFCLVLLSASAAFARLLRPDGYRREDHEHIISERPHLRPRFNASKIPGEWDWRDVGGHSYVTTNLNQHIPTYCGSCWAHGSMSALADRRKIALNGSGVDFMPSIQAMINCAGKKVGSCEGGDPMPAYAWVTKHGIPDVTCQQYKARDDVCTKETTCRNCAPNGADPSQGSHCFAQASYKRLFVLEHGIVGWPEPSNNHQHHESTELGWNVTKGWRPLKVHPDIAIMAEIMTRGPVACDIDAKEVLNYTNGVYHYKGHGDFDHTISLAGWGVEGGVDYWVGRNSWGSYWGEDGWFRVERGANYKPPCVWAVPKKELEPSE